MAKFDYWVARWVPEPARGEFVNIGVIVLATESSRWSFRLGGLQRARRLGGNPEKDALPRLMEELRRLDEMSPMVRLAVLEDYTQSWRNLLQLHGPVPASHEDIEEVTGILFRTLVA